MTDTPQLDSSGKDSSRNAFLLRIVGMLAVVAAMAAVGVVAYVLLRPGVPQHPAVGKKLPLLELQPLTGDAAPVTLGDLTGKVAVVHFWGTWCPPCVVELPDIAALEKKYRDRADVRILAVSCGQGETMTEDLLDLELKTAALLDLNEIDMPTHADQDHVSRQAFHTIGQFEAYPTTLMLDRQGVVRRVWVGIAKPDELELMIEQLSDES